MPELKRLHRYTVNSHIFSDDDDGLLMQPMDTEEQEELIQQLEKGNAIRNRRYVNALTAIYIICGLLFLLQMQRTHGKEFCLYTMGVLGIALSVISLRYEMVTDYRMFVTSQVYIDNCAVRMSNVVVLILMEWLALTDLPLKSLSQLPFLLFIVSLLVRKWSKSMDSELNSLRNMKYKYKNA